MKKHLLTIVLTVFAAACGNSPQNTAGPDRSSNQEERTRKTDDLTVSSHGQRPAGTPESAAPGTNNASGTKSKWTQSGDPIDTSSFDLKVAAAEKELTAKSNDESAKKALSAAYFERATALTDARQYASALGDYRRALKYDPANDAAKDWIGQIIGIYDSLNKSSPAEGEEPPPLEFKKGS